MPFDIQWEEHGVFIQHSGELLCREIIVTNEILYADRRFDTIMDYQIMSFLETTIVHLDAAEVKAIARMDSEASKRRPNVRVAVITDRDLLYGFSRMYQICTDRSTWETEIFETLAAARKWIHNDDAIRPA
jgi:hypothetical protein